MDPALMRTLATTDTCCYNTLLQYTKLFTSDVCVGMLHDTFLSYCYEEGDE